MACRGFLATWIRESFLLVTEVQSLSLSSFSHLTLTLLLRLTIAANLSFSSGLWNVNFPL